MMSFCDYTTEVECVATGYCAYSNGVCDFAAPAFWTCDPLNYNEGTKCHCGCGAEDPDCTKPCPPGTSNSLCNQGVRKLFCNDNAIDLSSINQPVRFFYTCNLGTLQCEKIPTSAPTDLPTMLPTLLPTMVPTKTPTTKPTDVPTEYPVALPTTSGTGINTDNPDPTFSPTSVPTRISETQGASVSLIGGGVGGALVLLALSFFVALFLKKRNRLQAPVVNDIIEDSFDAFLSHASDDTKAVERLARIMEEKGLSVWFDEDRLMRGQRNHEEIGRGLKASKVHVIFVSIGFVRKLNMSKSSNLEWEVFTMLETDRPKLVIMLSDISKLQLDPTKPFGLSIHPRLQKYRTFPLFGTDAEVQQVQLLDEIQRLCSAPAEP